MKLTEEKQLILDKFLEVVKDFPCTIKTDLWVTIGGKPHTIGCSTIKESRKFLKKDYHSANIVRDKVDEIVDMHPDLWKFTREEHDWAYNMMYQKYFRQQVLDENKLNNLKLK